MASNQIPPPSSSDPCSFDYLRNYNLPGSSGSGSTGESKDLKKRGFFKRLLHKKSSKKLIKRFREDDLEPAPVGGFRLPYEVKPPPMQSSERSRLFTGTQATAAHSTESVHDIAFTVEVPSSKARNTVLKVHAYEGEVQPLAREEYVRFSHPAVREVRPVTPMSLAGSHLDIADTLTVDEPSPAASTESVNATNNLQPKKIWRNSDVFKTSDGDCVSYREFKAQLDGHPTRSSKTFSRLTVAEHPPSLSFIPSVGSFTIEDDPVFRTDSCTPEPLRVHKYRDTALNMLTGGNGVLAVVPQADMPESAVPVLSKNYPAALTPAQFPAALTPGQRPFSFPTTVMEKHQYQAFNPDILSMKPKAKKTVNLAAPAFEEAGRPRTPTFFDEADQFHDLYARVESGLFENVNKQNTLFTPPPSKKTDKVARKPVTHTDQASNSTGNLLLSKSLPPTPRPALKQRTSSGVPTPHKMNENGYPIFERKSRPVSSMTMDKLMLDGMEEERRELEDRIKKQQEKVQRKERARRRD